MKLKPLIENQKIIIDDHRRGNREIKNWDDPSLDVHIDKQTYDKIDGEKQNVRIRIPINSERPITVESKKKKKASDVPRSLRKEIIAAFDDKGTRDEFMIDVVEILKNFKTNLRDEQRVQQVLRNLSRHFDLKWDGKKVAQYTNDALVLYTQKYNDAEGIKYFITVDKKKIKIGQVNGYSREQYSVRNS